MISLMQQRQQAQGIIELKTALSVLDDAYRNLSLSGYGGTYRISNAAGNIRSTLNNLQDCEDDGRPRRMGVRRFVSGALNQL